MEVNALRKTRETDINMTLCTASDAPGLYGSSGIGFFDHMLNAMCVHGSMRIELTMSGDLNVDCHHSVEDLGIVLGGLLAKVAGDKSSINRFGQFFIPMDESLALACIDICGRGCLVYDVPLCSPRIGEFETATAREFFMALAMNAGMALHIRSLYGINDHHRIEAVFKAVGHALKQALSPSDGALNSSKGVLQ